MPLISVVVPVYKTERYLPKCIDSLLVQTLKDLEIILVDDGSPDNSGAICDAYAAKHPNIRVVHKENGGLTQARVSGMREATGTYVTFVDSDDWVMPDMYLPMVQQAEEHGADIVAAGFIRDYGSRQEPAVNQIPSGIYREEKLAWLREHAIFDPDTMTQALAPCVWSKLYRSRTMLDTLLDRSDRIGFGEDSLFTYPALFKSTCVVVINEHQQYRYQIWEGSMTNSYYRNYFPDLYTVYDKLKATSAPVLTQKLADSIAYNYIFLYQGGIAQELGRGNPAGFFGKLRNLRAITKDARLGECLSRVDMAHYSPNTARRLRLLAVGRYYSYLALHYAGRLREKIRKQKTKASKEQ